MFEDLVRLRKLMKSSTVCFGTCPLSHCQCSRAKFTYFTLPLGDSPYCMKITPQNSFFKTISPIVFAFF